jgi:hypothetical protein
MDAAVPLVSPRYPFKREFVVGAPNDHGVYGLFDGRELIFLGIAGNDGGIRARLMLHISGKMLPCAATHYGWEVRVHPSLRYDELLAELIRSASVPRYNAGADKA